MQASLFSPLWYRVAEQHPHLRTDVRVQRQHVRDQRWYLLVNAANGRQYRIDDKAYEFIGRCDGERSVQQIWHDMLEQLGDAAPTQDQVIQTLSQLDENELLAYETAMHPQTLVRRRDERMRRRYQRFVNPFALRIPLGDPTPLLRRMDVLPALVFNRWVFWLWLALVAAGGLAAGSNGDALISHARQYMATPHYVLLAWICFPVIKAFHELGHAFALRHWGGEVHDVGFSLFVLVPAPYVDASAAAAFPCRYQRVIVGAAGIMVELALAAVALAVWMNVQPGTVRDLAFVTMFIASVSTLMFNGNPLLAFDAYYVLCDALDLPNLAARSKAWWTGTVLRAFGGKAARERMHLSTGEGKWLFLYAPLSIVYRIAISCLLVLWLGGHSAVLGAIAASFLIIVLVVKPAVSTLSHMWSSAPAGSARWRTAAGIFVVAAGLGTILCAVPFPFHTVVTGVVWPPEEALVRAGTDGFVKQVLARDGDRVVAGQALVLLDDPALFAQRDQLISRIDQLQAGRFDALLSSPERARNAEEEIARAQGELQRVEAKIGELDVRARTAGKLVMPHQQDLPGTFARQGSTIAYVLEPGDIGIRAVVPEYDATLVREETRSVEVHIAGDREPVSAELVRDIPAATYDLPSVALGDIGGGPHATDPADKEGLHAREPLVLVDLRLPATELQRVGGRAWVRFKHPAQPLASRWYRQVRQVFLQHFNPAG